jgi:putative salt-induced outer membrane protein YdiY
VLSFLPSGLAKFLDGWRDQASDITKPDPYLLMVAHERFWGRNDYPFSSGKYRYGFGKPRPSRHNGFTKRKIVSWGVG